MKEIARYVSRSESTILKWIRCYGFPACKVTGSWESDTEMIDEWRQKQIRKGIPKNKKMNNVKVKNW